ncbi:hypothetical protein V8F33_009744 [Rhypophila sp. PSN 637]
MSKPHPSPTLATSPVTNTPNTSSGGAEAETQVGQVKDYQTFVSFVLTISIFGASTFAVIMGQMDDPAEIWAPSPPPFTLAQVRTFLGISWLCFVLALAVAGYSSSILALWRQRAVRRGAQDGWWKNWDRFGVGASVLLHLLIVSAFLFLSIALVAYVGAVGWVMVEMSSAALVLGLGLSGVQIFEQI